MASAGQATAHSSQPTQRSRPSSCRVRMCRPRKRGYICSFSSGYWTVKGFLNRFSSVTPSPCPSSLIMPPSYLKGLGFARGSQPRQGDPPLSLVLARAVFVRRLARLAALEEEHLRDPLVGVDLGR